MNIYLKPIINPDECYREAEQKAAQYFNKLTVQATEKSYIPVLTDDIKTWKSDHVHHPMLSLFTLGKGKDDSKNFNHYIQYLNYRGKLDSYLNRSISYIFLRDLGKSLDSPNTQTRIHSVVSSLKDQLTNSKPDGEEAEAFSMVGLYRMAKKDGVELTYIWLLNKLKQVSNHIPKGMDAEHAQRKLIKIIAGVIMQENEEMDSDISSDERAARLDKAIRLGYSYGLTYPFIDDLLDAKILSDEEEKQYANLIRTTLTTGKVPKLGEWLGENEELITYVHQELGEAFQYIEQNQHPERRNKFFEQAYVFFHSQEVDREKNLMNSHYTNEELYIPVILKASSSRLIVRSVLSASDDKEMDNRTFYYGIYNQLSDDFADMFEDMKDGAVTPYTYYLKYHGTRPDLINPFELYWTVISNLIHNVYGSDEKTREVILDRAINGLKRLKKRVGTNKYKEIMSLFRFGNPRFNKLLQEMVRKAADVDFFDKLLRDHMITVLKNESKEREDFSNTIKTVRNEINQILAIPLTESSSFGRDSIAEAANYSLEGDGKRLRPIVTWFMSVKVYELDETAIMPLLKSLEYLHTASLLFDDLPAQDNAAMRRGRPTLHEVYNVAISELTGLFLTQKAIWEQTKLNQFDSKTVLQMIQYSSQTIADMCKGQAMDLESKGKPLSRDQLNTLCFYKTGIGFEAALVMPALLANAKEEEIIALKRFARFAGIAFQIKDDLLDVEGDAMLLGKDLGKDAENNSSTFVSILGQEAATIEMWENYCLAMDALQHVSKDTTFLKHFLNYLINREQ
ncbi:polyprenyl synthetase family protein [Psychrobacillus sp. FSL K6-2843]|uniref:polyprenyl synthetase family protein n=1 Tax=Psychrobacillus sp. FSL K6-2843 TaxID=2921549 RepID=UPI00315A2F97